MAPSPCLITAELTGTSVDEIKAQIAIAKADGADAVEFSLDAIEDFHPHLIPELVASTGLKTIVTYKKIGQHAVPEELRLERLRAASHAGVDFVEIDIELADKYFSAPPPKHESKHTSTIVASYNYECTPSVEELLALGEKLRGFPADIIKVITTALDISDTVRIFKFLDEAKSPTIAFALGARGEISRTLAPKYNSFLTYAYLTSPAGSAQELPTVYDAVHSYQIKRLGRASKVFGVVGKPISQSRGYLLYNAGMIEQNYDGIYLPFLVDDVELFFKTFNFPDLFAGTSVTAPHKQDAMKYLDEIDPAAKAIGAVSAILRRNDGTLIGYNMDWGAAIYAVEQGILQHFGGKVHGKGPLDDVLMVLAGAGGAGRGLAYGIKELGGHLLVADLDLNRAQEVATTFGGHTTTVQELAKPNAVEEVVKKFSKSKHPPVLCHATPVGMKPNVDRTVFTTDALVGYSVVFDAVYNPAETRLQREAKAAGATAVSGVEMFLREANEQFELFTSLPSPADVMRDVLLKNLAS